MTADPTIPTTREELERKVIEHLTWLEERRVQGSLDADYIAIASATVWSIAAGLVSEGITGAMAELARSAIPRAGRRVFVGKGRALVLTVGFRKGYRVDAYDTGTGAHQQLIKSDLDVGEREPAIDKFLERMQMGGYVQI